MQQKLTIRALQGSFPALGRAEGQTGDEHKSGTPERQLGHDRNLKFVNTVNPAILLDLRDEVEIRFMKFLSSAVV